MDTGRFGYWLMVGALLGIGVVGLASIGIFLLAAAVVLIAFGLVRLGPRRMWALVIGFGAAPALLLAFDVLTAGPPCPASGVITVPPGTNSATCSGHLDGYVQLALIFGGIALAGMLLPLVLRMVRRPRTQTG